MKRGEKGRKWDEEEGKSPIFLEIQKDKEKKKEKCEIEIVASAVERKGEKEPGKKGEADKFPF